jgi:zinc protease
VIAAVTAGCRTPPGSPVRPGDVSAAAEAARPSGVHTRASFSLDNGLRVILEENHAAPVVAMQVWLGAGAADDAPGQEGTAHVIQHVLRRSIAADREAASAGAQTGAWASYDETVVHALIASPFVTDGLRALASAVARPALLPADFEAARAAARDDLRAARTDPQRVAAAAALAAAYAAHPYGRPLLGTEASLAALSLDQLRAAYLRAYGAGGSTLVVVGDFDPMAARAAVAERFGAAAWTRGDRPPSRPAEPAQQAARVAVSTGDLGTVELALGWKTAGVRSDDRAGLALLAAILGRGGRTRLEDELVRNRQLALEARAFLFAPRDVGLLVVSATLLGSGTGAVEAATTTVIEDATRLAREGPSPDELSRARTVVEREEIAQKAGVGGYAGRLGLYAAVTGDPELEAAHLRRVRDIEAGEVKDIAARYLRSSGLTVAAVMPTSGARGSRNGERTSGLAERLRAIALGGAGGGPERATGVAAPVMAARQDVVLATLASGVRLVLLTHDGADEMSVRAIWPGGVRREDTRIGGANALMARLLARRTKTRSPEQVAAEVAQIGGRLEGFAGLDALGVRADFLGSRWERGLELMVDCLRNPRFSDDDVEQDRRVLLDELRVRDDDPAAVARRIFDETLFRRHPYRHGVLGSVDSVAGLTRRRLLDFFRASYEPRGLTIAIVGGVAAERVVAKMAALFADLPPAPPAVPFASALPTTAPPPAPLASASAPPPPASAGPSAPPAGAVAAPPSPAMPAPEPREVVRFAPTVEAQIVIGYPGVSLGDPDRLALDVLGEILGGQGGRLAALHDRRGLVDGVTVRALAGVDPGAFSIHAGAHPGDLEAAVAGLRAELAALVAAGVTPEEVALARRALVGRRALALVERGSVASALALGAVMGDPGRSPRRDADELTRISAEDVTRAARRVIDPRREILAVVRPREQGRGAPHASPAGLPSARAPATVVTSSYRSPSPAR